MIVLVYCKCISSLQELIVSILQQNRLLIMKVHNMLCITSYSTTSIIDPATSAAAVADNPLPSDTQQQVYSKLTCKDVAHTSVNQVNQDTTTGEVGSITQGPIVINVLPSTTPAKEDGNKFLTKVVLALFIVVILLLLRYVPIGQASILF